MVTRSKSTLEDAPEYFWERFSAYAQTWPVSPEPLGSPVLEVLTPWGPLFVFDRSLLPIRTGQTPLILHGQVESWQAGPNTPALQHQGGGRYRLVGQVEAVLDIPFFVLQLTQPKGGAGLRLVLAASDPPSAGQWVEVHLKPPLMAFRPDTYTR